MNKKSGFTLIELLVVIAIIGVLSSVVLASLNTARSKGNDAAIQANLGTVKTQATLFYGNNGNAYDDATGTVLGDCSASDGAGGIFADTTVQNVIAAVDGMNGTGSIVCNSTATEYAIYSSLTAGGWCADSTGFSGNSAVLAVGATACTPS
jgi:prepilin-type N-terminal cleavage/methylation domain-containing protein